jgi:hypothetical protein
VVLIERWRSRVSVVTFEQFTDRDAVVVERSIASSASHPHPGTERLQQFGLCRGRPMITTGRFVDPLQKAGGLSRSSNNLIGIGASLLAPPEVITEAFDNLFTQIMSRQTLSNGPPLDALRCSSVAKDGYPRVPVLKRPSAKPSIDPPARAAPTARIRAGACRVHGQPADAQRRGGLD